MNKPRIVISVELEPRTERNIIHSTFLVCSESSKVRSNEKTVTFRTKSEIPAKIFQIFDHLNLEEGSKLILITETSLSDSALDTIENYLGAYSFVNLNLVKSSFDKGLLVLNQLKYYAVVSKALAFLSGLNLNDALSGVFGLRYSKQKIEVLKSQNLKSLSHLNLGLKKIYQLNGKYNLIEISHPEAFPDFTAVLKDFFSLRSVGDFVRTSFKNRPFTRNLNI